MMCSAVFEAVRLLTQRERDGERRPSAPAARPVKVSLLEVGD